MNKYGAQITVILDWNHRYLIDSVMMFLHAQLQITELLMPLLQNIAISILNSALGCLLSCHTCQYNVAESLIRS